MFKNLINKATGGLEGIIDELLKTAHDKIKEKVKESFSIHKLKELKKNISRVGKVKTILNPDSIVSLNEIFVDDTITFYDEERQQSVNYLNYFSSKQVLVEGGPGQGKSLYLRHLCLLEGQKSNYIPIFIEFRYLKFKKSLREELFEAIKDFGVELDDDLFDYLAKSKKILFILDGFDEIPSSARNTTAKELETIARTYPDLNIIISSRPDSGMGASVYFKKYKISYLKIEQQTNFIKHIYKNDEQCQNIINVLTENTFISEVTNTPLLLTLFTITYNAWQFRPDNLSEFYSRIFPTMLYRHDRMKIGYERERKSKLTDFQMQRLFEAFSFISLKGNRTRFISQEFREYLEKASKKENITENIEDKLIEDITQITALIVIDGYDEYSFSHKSIQEYFAAVFISKIDDQAKFYKNCVESYDQFTKWQNVLSFLETIDEHGYKKSFLLPLKKKALGLDKNNKIKFDYPSLLQLIGESSKLQVDEDGNLIKAYWGDTFSIPVYKEYSSHLRIVLQKYLEIKKIKIAEFISYCAENDYENYRHDDKTFILSLSSVLKKSDTKNNICSFFSNELEKSSLIQEIKRIEIELQNHEDAVDQILNF